MENSIRDFFSAIYRLAPPESLIAWGDLTNPLYIPVNQFSEVVDSIPQDKDMYYTPAVLKAAQRTKANVAGAGVLWADVDNHKGHNTQPLLPPTFIINSGKGNHYLYLLDEFYPTEQIEAGNKTLANHLRLSGQGCWNANRLLRVPGSINNKYLNPDKYPEYTEPLPCTIVDANLAYIYKLEHILKLKQYRPDLLVIQEKESRSERDQRLAVLLTGWGLPDSYVRSSLLLHSTKAQEEPGHYLDFTLEKSTQWVEKKKKKEVDDKPLANVEFTPQAWLVGPNGQEIGLAVKLTWGAYSVIAGANAGDFSSRSAIIRWLTEHTGTRTFYGSDAKALALWGAMTETCPAEQRQLKVAHAGRYDLPNGVVYIYDSSSALSNKGQATVFWQPDIKVNQSLYLGDSEELPDLQEYAEVLELTLKTQPPETILPTLGWTVSSVFKPLFETIGASFPIMMLYGTRGSGKTTLIQDVLLPTIGAFVRPVSSDVTTFALGGHLGLTNAWPVWVGEYRASNNNSTEFQQLLRSAYDSGMMERGRPNQSVASYSLVAPVVVDGETPFSEPANLDRSISVRLLEESIHPGTVHEDAYQRLRTWNKVQRGPMARHLLSWSLGITQERIKAYMDTSYAVLDGNSLTARSLNNLSVVWTGLLLLQDYIAENSLAVNLEFNKDYLIKIAGNTHIPGLGTRTQIDTVVEQISHFWLLPDLEAEWEQDTGMLWFNMTKTMYALRIRVDQSMLRMQLQERVGHYITGPARRKGGAEYWGIDLSKAQKFGLDVYKPEKLRASGVTFL